MCSRACKVGRGCRVSDVTDDSASAICQSQIIGCSGCISSDYFVIDLAEGPPKIQVHAVNGSFIGARRKATCTSASRKTPPLALKWSRQWNCLTIVVDHFGTVASAVEPKNTAPGNTCRCGCFRQLNNTRRTTVGISVGL